MSREIPFLEMFAALNRWTELAAGVSGWRIVSAAIDQVSRSADLVVSGAAGAGPNLVREAQDMICRAYGLSSVRIRTVQEQPTPAAPEKAEERPAAPPAEKIKADAPQNAFAKAQAIRAAAMKKAAARPAAPVQTKGNGKAIFGKEIKKQPIPMSDLELDMGMVVVEGDVFAVDHRELKKRGAWVVAFDVTDYTGSIRVNKFVPGDEGKPIVDGVRKGMHLRIQGRLNLDRFYGDVVLEPVAIMTAEQEVRTDNAPKKRVELHLHTNMSAMDALTAVGFKTDSTIGAPRHRHHRPRRDPRLSQRQALRQEDQDPLRGRGVLYQRCGRPCGGARGRAPAL